MSARRWNKSNNFRPIICVFLLLLLLFFGVRESLSESCVSILCWKLIPSLNRNKICFGKDSPHDLGTHQALLKTEESAGPDSGSVWDVLRRCSCPDALRAHQVLLPGAKLPRAQQHTGAQDPPWYRR